jgi:prophage antirepressor-like protein
MTIVNEYSLYALAFRSAKPKAPQFRRWVIHEVLPSIRETGRYETNPEDRPQIENQAPNQHLPLHHSIALGERKQGYAKADMTRKTIC